MRHRRLGWIALALAVQGGVAVAQSSLDALEQELQEATQQHQDATTQSMAAFFSQIDAAMAGPDAALALYQQAGGSLPAPMPVVKEHFNETVSERDVRTGQDRANLAAVAQLHCGLMHYAALFAVKPDQAGLHDDWVAWLQNAALVYPQLAAPVENADQQSEEHKMKKDDGTPATPGVSAFGLTDLKAKAMRDSIISKFLHFNGWEDKDQGKWAIQDLPRLYRTYVLDPSRASPTAATLTAWDAYIAMASADEPDNDKWSQVDFPPLQFDRACDDYAVAPGTDKLEALVNIIKANPTYPKVDDWIAKVHQLMDDYRARQAAR